MRKIVFILIILCLPTTLWAADPIIGTWKLNIAKSKYPLGKEPPKEQTETYRELADGYIELTDTNIDKDGLYSQLVLTYPTQGGIAKVLKGDLPLTIVQIRVSQNEWYVTFLRDGKQNGIRHKQISNDGKILRQTVRYLDRDGQFESLLIYEKQ